MNAQRSLKLLFYTFLTHSYRYIDAKPAILAWPLSLFSGFIYIVIRPVFYNIFHLLYPFTHMINFQFPEPFMKNSRLYYFSILSFSNQNLKISNKNATPSEVAS